MQLEVHLLRMVDPRVAVLDARHGEVQEAELTEGLLRDLEVGWRDQQIDVAVGSELAWGVQPASDGRTFEQDWSYAALAQFGHDLRGRRVQRCRARSQPDGFGGWDCRVRHCSERKDAIRPLR